MNNSTPDLIITVDRPALQRHLTHIYDAAYALEGLKRGLDHETQEDKLNGYTIGALITGISLIGDSITARVEQINRMAGLEEV